MVKLNKHTWLLNEARDIINEELKEKFEREEIRSPWEIFYKPTYLDVIYLLNFNDIETEDVTAMYIRDLIMLLKIHKLSDYAGVKALKCICAYINNTNTCHLWNRKDYKYHFKVVLNHYFGYEKPINYDYMRLVINTHLEEKTSTIV